MLTLLNLLIHLFSFLFEESSLSPFHVHPISNSPFTLTAEGHSSLGPSLFPQPLNLFLISLVSVLHSPCSSCYLLFVNAALLPSPLNILNWLLLEVGFLA
ncbi:unnamed protein product [Microthlaspi erraticum]|uniref:Uncharacterized protein n=1 Tax=Microthlaspi erraticum TaxID=1685480 RepID=A0A6D2KWS1_9BRAS|nr:unnamed protein product [Microthlaspi erraticum]